MLGSEAFALLELLHVFSSCLTYKEVDLLHRVLKLNIYQYILYQGELMFCATFYIQQLSQRGFKCCKPS